MCKQSIWLLLLLAFGALVYAQELAHDDTLRGAFIRTREKKPRAVLKATARQTAKHNAEKTHPSALPSLPTMGEVEEPLALGYTIFKKDARGLPQRISPATTFHANDAVRFTIEPNSDGYFYIFTRENEGAMKLLFPSSRLRRGENFLYAHHLYEVPSRQEQDPNNQWFIFDDHPAQEHFYFVLSRAPITEIPSGAALQKFDAQAAGQEWTAPESLWEAFVAKMSIPLRTNQRLAENQKMHRDEVAAITRGVGLKPKSPAPSVVNQHKETGENWLVIKVTLTHQ